MKNLHQSCTIVTKIAKNSSPASPNHLQLQIGHPVQLRFLISAASTVHRHSYLLDQGNRMLISEFGERQIEIYTKFEDRTEV
nr:hypothetical protein Iba_chr07bCG8870 [Ipomoea batatas]